MVDNKLGKAIATLRKKMNLTQKSLSNGICTQPTISMIERGEIIPGLDILIPISIKLGKPITYFIDILLITDYEYIRKFVYDIEELTIRQEFKTVYDIVKTELSKKNKDRWFEIFLKWQYYLSSYKIGNIEIHETISKLKKLVKNPDSILNKDYLCFKIYNTIAFLYAIKEDYPNSLLFYNKINFNIPPSYAPRLNQNIYQLRIIYNKSKTLYDMRNYEDAIKNCKEGIEKSIQYENMSIIGNFFYYLGLCYEKKNMKKEQIPLLYKKALFFFELLNREIYSNILKKEKQDFL